jgi:hypothetical protein
MSFKHKPDNIILDKITSETATGDNLLETHPDPNRA